MASPRKKRRDDANPDARQVADSEGWTITRAMREEDGLQNPKTRREAEEEEAAQVLKMRHHHPNIHHEVDARHMLIGPHR